MNGSPDRFPLRSFRGGNGLRAMKQKTMIQPRGDGDSVNGESHCLFTGGPQGQKVTSFSTEIPDQRACKMVSAGASFGQH
jgi:hypothetical protein